MRWGCLRGGTGQEGRRGARAGGWGRTCRHSGVHGTTAAGDSPIPGPLSTKTAPANEHLLSSAHPKHDKHSNAAPPNPPRNPPPKPMTGEPQICAPGPWAFGTAPPCSPSLRIAALCPRGGLQPRAPRDAGGLEEAPGTCLLASASRTARPCRAIPSCLGLMPHLVVGSGSWGPRGRFNSWCICRADRARGRCHAWHTK